MIKRVFTSGGLALNCSAYIYCDYVVAIWKEGIAFVNVHGSTWRDMHEYAYGVHVGGIIS